MEYSVLSFQERNLSSVSLKDATGGSPTAATGRSIHTYTRPTNPTTAACVAATRVTRIHPLSENTWRFTVNLPANLKKVETNATDTTQVSRITRTLLHPNPPRRPPLTGHRRQRIPNLPSNPPKSAVTAAAAPLPTTQRTTRYTSQWRHPRTVCTPHIRHFRRHTAWRRRHTRRIWASGTCVRARRACPHRPPQNIPR